MSTAKIALGVGAGIFFGGIALCAFAGWMVTPHGASEPLPRKKTEWTEATIDRLFAENVVDAEKTDNVQRLSLKGGDNVSFTVQPGTYMVLFRLRGAMTANLHNLEGRGDVSLSVDDIKNPPVGMSDVPKEWAAPLTFRLEGARSADLAFLALKPD